MLEAKTLLTNFNNLAIVLLNNEKKNRQNLAKGGIMNQGKRQGNAFSIMKREKIRKKGAFIRRCYSHRFNLLMQGKGSNA